MPSLIILGVILALAGIVSLFLPSVFTDVDRTVTDAATLTEVSTLTIPLWLSWVAVAGGFLLMLLGAVARPRRY